VCFEGLDNALNEWQCKFRCVAFVLALVNRVVSADVSSRSP
jgi:hypothetical protein